MSNHWLKTTLGRLTFVCGRPGRPIWTQWWAWCQMLHQALILSTPEKHGKAPVRAHRMKRASTSSDPIGSGNRKRIYQNMSRQKYIAYHRLHCLRVSHDFSVKLPFPVADSRIGKRCFNDMGSLRRASKPILEIDLNCAKLLAFRPSGG